MEQNGDRTGEATLPAKLDTLIILPINKIMLHLVYQLEYLLFMPVNLYELHAAGKVPLMLLLNIKKFGTG